MDQGAQNDPASHDAPPQTEIKFDGSNLDRRGGWINYYGRFYKSALYPTLRRIDLILA